MADKAKFAFGSLANLQGALDSGAVDKFDLLCLMDGDVPKIGWVSKTGEPVILETEDDVVEVEALPETGTTGIVYVYQGVIHIWDGTEFISMTNSKELAELTTLVESKVSQETVVQMIEEKVAEISEIPVVEF